MNFKLLLSLLVIVGATSGCESLWANKEKQKEVKAEIKNKGAFFPETPSAIFVDRPELKSKSVVAVKRDPLWMQATVPTSLVSDEYLYSIMRTILNGASINVSYAHDEANTPVSAKIGGTVKDSLETISAATGLSYEVTGNSIKWSQYITESFPVAYIPGKYAYNIGSAAGSDSSGGNGGASSVKFGTESNQFSNVSGDGTDAFDEIEKIVGQIVGEYGEVNISRTTSSVIVTTSKARMERVKQYMSKVDKSLGRQIAFEIKILRFTSSATGQTGIDWNRVQTKADGALKFSGGDLSGLVSGNTGAPVTFSTSKTTGSMSGSDVLLQILQEQGKVSVVNQPKIVTQVNRVAQLELSNLEGYISQTSITNSYGGSSGSGSSGVSPTVTMTPGVVESGYTIYAMGNISADDKIILYMASTYTDLMGITRKEVKETAIETPKMSRSKMVNTTVLRNGATMIIGGLQLQSTFEENGSPISPTALPTRNSHKSSITETIALVTPVILDMN